MTLALAPARLERTLVCNSVPPNKSTTIASSTSEEEASRFVRVEAIIRPWKLESVLKALVDEGIRGLHVEEVQGFGSQVRELPVAARVFTIG